MSVRMLILLQIELPHFFLDLVFASPEQRGRFFDQIASRHTALQVKQFSVGPGSIVVLALYMGPTVIGSFRPLKRRLLP